jgi:hypothetical protein
VRLCQSAHRPVKLGAQEGERLHGEGFAAGRGGKDGGDEDEALEGAQTGAVEEACEVESAEGVRGRRGAARGGDCRGGGGCSGGGGGVEGVAEAIGEGGIAGETLGFLDEEAEGEGGGGIEGGVGRGGGGAGAGVGGGEEARVGVGDEAPDEVEVGVDAMLF